LNKAVNRNLRLRHITYRDETEIYCTLGEKDYRKLKKMAGHRYHLTVVKEGGAAPSIRKFRMNKGAILGMTLFILFYLLQFSFVSVTGKAQHRTRC